MKNPKKKRSRVTKDVAIPQRHAMPATVHPHLISALNLLRLADYMLWEFDELVEAAGIDIDKEISMKAAKHAVDFASQGMMNLVSIIAADVFYDDYRGKAPVMKRAAKSKV